MKLLNKDIQVVGDDLFVTNKERLIKGINSKALLLVIFPAGIPALIPP